MCEIHAAQFVAGSVEMRFHAAEGQTENLRSLLVGLSARRPEEALLFPDRQLDRKGRQFEIYVRGRINEDREELKSPHIACLVGFPFVSREIAGTSQMAEPPVGRKKLRDH